MGGLQEGSACLRLQTGYKRDAPVYDVQLKKPSAKRVDELLKCTYEMIERDVMKVSPVTVIQNPVYGMPRVSAF
jgi:hypothetical protein